MFTRQYLAKWFLFLACLVVLVCTAQRVVGMHALHIKAAESVMLLQESASEIEEDAPVSPCELSAKSLLAATPMLFEGVLLVFSLLVTLFAPLRVATLSVVPATQFFSPSLRVYLRFCVFRE